MTRLSIALLAGVAALGFASSSYAADLIVETPIVEPGIVDVGGNWDGAFVGVFAGYGWGDADHTGSDADPDDLGASPFAPGGADVDVSGWLLGVNAGANFTLGNGIVAGVVGDLAWSGMTGEETYDIGPDVDVGFDVNWMGSVRGRLGFDGGAFLPYLTAGLAFANGSLTTTPGFVDPVDEADATHIGWTVGAGVEFAVADNLSLDLLYRYTDLGQQTYDVGAGDFNPVYDLNAHTVTLGLNWGF